MKDSSSIKLVSINIEGARHLKSVLDFLYKTQPDVICLQEVFKRDFEWFKTELGMQGSYAIMVNKPDNRSTGGKPISFGIGTLSTHELKNIKQQYYFGSPDSIDTIPKEDGSKEYRVFLSSVITRGKTDFIIGNTHFTWTPDGQADNFQREHIVKMLQILDSFPEIIFCGDFNAPRGKEIFQKIAERYRDHIPKKYTTSIDKDLHRKGDLQLMVDGLFSSKEYKTKNVHFIAGISDHQVLSVEIVR